MFAPETRVPPAVLETAVLLPSYWSGGQPTVGCGTLHAMVEVEPPPSERASDPERPLLSAHPWRLPILLGLAFAVTVAIAAAMLREKPRATYVAHPQKQR